MLNKSHRHGNERRDSNVKKTKSRAISRMDWIEQREDKTQIQFSGALAVRKGTFLLSFLFSLCLFTFGSSELLVFFCPTPVITASFFSACTQRRRAEKSEIFISFMYENANHHAEKWASFNVCYRRLLLVARLLFHSCQHRLATCVHVRGM